MRCQRDEARDPKENYGVLGFCISASVPGLFGSGGLTNGPVPVGPCGIARSGVTPVVGPAPAVARGVEGVAADERLVVDTAADAFDCD